MSVDTDAESDTNTTHDPVYTLGTIVRDREDPDPDPAVVVNCPPVACEEWGAYYHPERGDVTVADDNPEYDPEAEVIVVAYQDDLEDAHPDWKPADGPLPLDAAACATYAFPPGRLEPVDDTPPSDTDADADADADPDPDPPEALLALRDRLVESATVDLARAGDTYRLDVEKLGTAYTIHPDGTVTGDGPFAEDLTALAEEYLDT